MTSLDYCRGSNLKDIKTRQSAAADMAEFVSQIGAERAPVKDGAAYFCGPMGGDGKRCTKNALPRRWVAIDLDGIEVSVMPAVREWAGRFNGCAWFTHTSTPEAPRMRVIVELERPATRDECIALGTRLQQEVHTEFGDSVKWDDSTLRPEQPVFVPPSGEEILRLNGTPLPVLCVPEPQGGATAP